MRWLDGGAATAQILLGTSQSEEVLVPASCVVEDGAERIVFVRDPANAAQVIRTPVELGRRSRDRVEILGGRARRRRARRQGCPTARPVGQGQGAGGRPLPRRRHLARGKQVSMLDLLIRWSLQRRGIVLGLAVLLLVAGAVLVPRMPIEVFPSSMRRRSP